jgi:hypothetical protein
VIGSRPKVVNDNNIKSIYFRETPGIIYGDGDTSSPAGYRYIQASNIDHMFACSA